MQPLLYAMKVVTTNRRITAMPIHARIEPKGKAYHHLLTAAIPNINNASINNAPVRLRQKPKIQLYSNKISSKRVTSKSHVTASLTLLEK